MAFLYPNTYDLKLDKLGELNFNSVNSGLINNEELLRQEVLRYIIDNDIYTKMLNLTGLDETLIVERTNELFESIQLKQFFIDNFLTYSINLLSQNPFSFEIIFVSNSDNPQNDRFVYNFNTLGNKSGFGDEIRNVSINPNNKVIKLIRNVSSAVFFNGTAEPTNRVAITLPTLIKNESVNNLNIRILRNGDQQSFLQHTENVTDKVGFKYNLLEYIPDKDADISDVNIYKNEILLKKDFTTYFLSGNIIQISPSFEVELFKSPFSMEIIYLNDDTFEKNIETKVNTNYDNTFETNHVYSYIEFNFKQGVAVTNDVRLYIEWRK